MLLCLRPGWPDRDPQKSGKRAKNPGNDRDFLIGNREKSGKVFSISEQEITCPFLQQMKFTVSFHFFSFNFTLFYIENKTVNKKWQKRLLVINLFVVSWVDTSHCFVFSLKDRIEKRDTFVKNLEKIPNMLRVFNKNHSRHSSVG